MAFEFPQKVLFKHCDPAGIVFYPRYFEMINDCIEAFFADALEQPFEEILKSGGIPTVQISANFKQPSFHGDQLILALYVSEIGRTSFSYRLAAHCGSEYRFEATGTLVNTNSAGRPTAWDDNLRNKLSTQM
jgi:4-hydroxybenzoyl-CoA thioesterase